MKIVVHHKLNIFFLKMTKDTKDLKSMMTTLQKFIEVTMNELKNKFIQVEQQMEEVKTSMEEVREDIQSIRSNQGTPASVASETSSTISSSYAVDMINGMIRRISKVVKEQMGNIKFNELPPTAARYIYIYIFIYLN